MGYLFCKKCKRHYKLQYGEKPEEYDPRCKCGGTYKYVEKLSFWDKKTPIQFMGLLILGLLCFGILVVASPSFLSTPDSSYVQNSPQPTTTGSQPTTTSSSDPYVTPAQNKASNDYDAGYKDGYKIGYYGYTPNNYSGDYGDGYDVGYKFGVQDRVQGLTPEWDL